jgi:transcriptional regulator with XRE-family HTH domain
MKLHKWEDVRAEAARVDPTFEEGVELLRRQREFVMGLQELRKGRKVTQKDLAEVLGMSQANVSRIEREDDILLSTLDKYAAALGGRVEIRVKFDDDVEYVLGPDGVEYGEDAP